VTSIQVWAGVDTRGVASLYIASDSRISWAPGHHWDQGRKVFAADRKPHIFGYWGDVLFPALALPQISDQIDYALTHGADEGEWRRALERRVRTLWRNYPSEERRSFGIVHGFRIGEGTGSRFGLTILEYDAQVKIWASRTVPMPPKSAVLHIAGSGAWRVDEAQGLWALSESAGTSRAVYGAFVESVLSGLDGQSGGPPQLCGLYRIDGGRVIGTVVGNRRYFAGADIDEPASTDTVQWHNELFEITDGSSKRRSLGAQPHLPR
jgi:hypothetical protein